MRPGAEQITFRDNDGTEVELYVFDLGRHRLGLYDQDQDDEKPFDNTAEIDRTVDQIVTSLELQGHRIAMAWNGPFFAYDFTPQKVGRHIGPVVLDGVIRYNVGNHRWTFGWGSSGFELLHLPSKPELSSKKFKFAVSGLQALVLQGKALALEPFPRFASEIQKGPAPSTSKEAGHIPMVDHMRTSRTSLAWSRDGKKLFVLIVREPDHELGSKLGLKRGEAQEGGWTLADLQRFWLAFGVWGAINSDGGDVTQRWVGTPAGADFAGPKNKEGTLMTFFVSQRVISK